MSSDRLEGVRLPEHVAIIMDGNGRWAAAHGVPRAMGHKRGAENLEVLLEDAARMGIKYLTVYAFSTENWKRSAEEVGALMSLFRVYIPKLLKKASDNNIRVRMIGDKSRFDPDLIEGIDAICRETEGNTAMTFAFAVNYGGRDELVRAVKKIAAMPDRPEITEQLISDSLDTAGMPDPDLLIRTGGDLRVSNFLLWQIAYTELYTTQTLWPDFHRKELEDAVIAFGGRERRFGGR